jgi:hypothetical protein
MLDATRPLDAMLLRLGGRRWLAKRFAVALDHLSDQLVPATGSVQEPAGADIAAMPRALARRAA